jgi:hypothetical protein
LKGVTESLLVGSLQCSASARAAAHFGNRRFSDSPARPFSSPPILREHALRVGIDALKQMYGVTA